MPRRSVVDLDIVAAITVAQSGLVTARQLHDAGVSRGTLSHRIRTGGPWRRLLPGVYLVTGGSPDRHQQRVAALLLAGPSAVLTGRDALDLHGLERKPVPADAPVHVLVAHTTRRTSHGFALIERTRRPVQPVIRDGLALAPVPRAVVDCARRLQRRSDVAALVARAIQGGFATVGAVDEEARAAHRRSTALLNDVMDDIRAGTRSAPESDLRQLWLASGLTEPLWNPTLLTASGNFLARPDAYVVSAGVAVEVDSVEFHFSPVDWTRTMERQTRMTAHGIVVIATPPSRIRNDGVGLMRDVAAAIRAHDGRSQPRIRLAKPNTGSS